MKTKPKNKQHVAARMIRMSDADWNAANQIAARYGLRTAQLLRKVLRRIVRDDALTAEIVGEAVE